jgi:hypothetical protein
MADSKKRKNMPTMVMAEKKVFGWELLGPFDPTFL